MASDQSDLRHPTNAIFVKPDFTLIAFCLALKEVGKVCQSTIRTDLKTIFYPFNVEYVEIPNTIMKVYKNNLRAWARLGK